MNITRRSALGLGAGVFAFALTGMKVQLANASAEKTDAAIKAFTGGAEMMSGGVNLTTPEIAENGNTVPIGVSVDSPMSADDYVESVAIYAAGNPNPEVVTFNFTPASGVAEAKTRIRLAGTQDVVAVAKMSTGKFVMAKNQVKVTIGGCGG
ncbi:MAG: thiosulfate oxidation carrier protein SoxY [Nitratireductor sp.]